MINDIYSLYKFNWLIGRQAITDRNIVFANIAGMRMQQFENYNDAAVNTQIWDTRND